MSNDNYNQRLKQIRDKYGASFKQITSISKNNTNQYTRPMSSININERFSKTTKGGFENEKRQNQDKLQQRRYQHNYTNSFKQPMSSYNDGYLNHKQLDTSSYLITKNRQERLKQIQKIRQNYAQTRNKTIQDWNKQIQNSRRNNVQTQNYAFKQRINQLPIRNPEMQKSYLKEDITKNTIRNRTQSYSMRNQDYQINNKLKRNYQYPKQNIKQTPYSYQINKDLNSYRSDLKNIDKQNNISSFVRQFDYQSKNLKKQQSQTTSPIRGLMKFDSVQKKRNIDFGQKSYNLSNIDRIQERIQQILNSK